MLLRVFFYFVKYAFIETSANELFLFCLSVSTHLSMGTCMYFCGSI